LTHVADVTPGLYERIAEAGKNDLSGKVSGRDWPITGGTLSDEALKAESGRDILLTGHEDGSVKFWSCSGIALSPLASVRTNKFFVGDDLDEPRGSFLAKYKIHNFYCT
jgi:lethal(2) giant larvae protein